MERVHTKCYADLGKREIGSLGLGGLLEEVGFAPCPKSYQYMGAASSTPLEHSAPTSHPAESEQEDKLETKQVGPVLVSAPQLCKSQPNIVIIYSQIWLGKTDFYEAAMKLKDAFSLEGKL